MTSPRTFSDRRAALDFIAGHQSDPRTMCAFVGTRDEGLENDLDGLDQPWLDTLRVLTDEGGQLTAAACIEWDPESDMAWVYGPWFDEGVDAAALLAEVVAQTPVSTAQMYAPVANERMSCLAADAGWDVGSSGHVYRTSRVSLVAPHPRVRPATADDLVAIASLHEAEFPDTYATARQLLDPEQPYTTLVADHDEAVAGYVSGQIDEGDVYLDFLAVDPQRRRRGFARELVAGLASTLEGADVTLTVSERHTEARAMYEATGWTAETPTRSYTLTR